MHSNEIIVAVLKAVYLEHMGKQQTADTFKMHRNTVYNICNTYKDKVPELVQALQGGKEAESLFTRKIACHIRKGKVTEEHKKTIQEYCKNHLNCQRLKMAPERYMRNLCNAYGVRLKDVIGYNPNTVQIPDGVAPVYERKNTYLKNIRKIRNYYRPVKNYGEVYNILCCTCKIFQEHPVTYSTFYRYAKDYWDDNVLGGLSFGDSGLQWCLRPWWPDAGCR